MVPFSPRGRRGQSQSDIQRERPALCYRERSPWSSTFCPLPGTARRPTTSRKRRCTRRRCPECFEPGTALRKFGQTRTLQHSCQVRSRTCFPLLLELLIYVVVFLQVFENVEKSGVSRKFDLEGGNLFVFERHANRWFRVGIL